MKELLDKTNIGNIIAGIVILIATIYACITKNTDLITFLAGAAIGYLFKRQA